MRVAIAGLAHFHVQYVLDEVEARGGRLELVGLSDPDPANRATWGVGREDILFDDHAEMLAATKPDVVAVFDVYARRAATVVAAVRAGASVLVDKPLCTTEEELELLEAVTTGGAVVSTIFEKRWYPETLAVRDALAAGVIGQVRQLAFTAPHKLKRPTRPDWFFDARYGSIASDLLSHDIDLFLSLTGIRAGSVTAWEGRGADPARPEWADSCVVMLAGGDVAASMEANWLWPDASEFHGQYRMRITGSEGVLEVDWARHEVVLLTRTEGPRRLDLPEGARPAAEAFDALLGGAAPEVGTAQSFAVARIGLLAARSARNGTALSWEL